MSRSVIVSLSVATLRAAPLNSIYKASQEKNTDLSRSGTRAAFLFPLTVSLLGYAIALLLGLRISSA